MSSKNELVIIALQQRIGELVASYETQVAILRAELTEMINAQQKRQDEIDEYNQELAEKISNS